MTKDEQKFALLSFETAQFMDVRDNELEKVVVKDIFKNWKYGSDLLEDKVKQKGDLIRFIENPSKKVKDLVFA